MATVLFVCLHNAGRSQMSAALFERAARGRHRALSAGTTPADRVHPEVVQVMIELGVDLAGRTPRKLTRELAEQADVVVTMGCGDECPYIPGKRYVDWELEDPKGRPIDEVRATRDDIAQRVRALVEELDDTAVLRPATPADRPALIALALAEDAAWSGAPAVSAEEVAEAIDPYGPGVIFERDGGVAGYAAVGEGGRSILLLDPSRSQSALEALVAWLGERDRHEIHTYARDAPRIAWLEANGFTHRLSSFDLQRGIDPPLAPAVWPDAIAVARYRPGEDDDAVHALIYVDAEWGEVPGHMQRSLESWRSTLTPEARGWVARRAERPVGWVVGRVFSDGRGWVEQIAVARSARRLGLGRALLLHSLAELRVAGATSFALGVQAENEDAIGLYRDVGFEVEREWRVYARPTA